MSLSSKIPNPNLKRLQRLIKANEKEKTNLIKSLRVGKASATATSIVLSEIDRIEHETEELKQQVIVEEDRHFGLSEADIMYFLSQLVKGCEELDDIKNRELLVNVLINSVYVYENEGGHEVTVVFNVSNQPPVKVDIPLLDEIRGNSNGSNTAYSLPYEQKSVNG